MVRFFEKLLERVLPAYGWRRLPSVWPETLGLVTVESISLGVFSGLKTSSSSSGRT